jgi:hypothetical protein
VHQIACEHVQNISQDKGIPICKGKKQGQVSLNEAPGIKICSILIHHTDYCKNKHGSLNPTLTTINWLQNQSLVELIDVDDPLHSFKSPSNLVHPSDELIDVVLTVTSITTLHVLVPLLLQASQWCLQLEWPEEVVCLLEMWANSHDLMNKIFNADDVMLAQALKQH